ncbi:uncharacterized protein LOC112058525 [Bicyclus anynana]|uniref:Uncharacterized protein LOC112058525 n=1 Tax=Bicyclus anynana TaxID=110368 RepID=A0ABM3M765_BICAN|nr:uncharacterized protein LOC112058525 [Bicyclus anynana]
MCANTVQFEYDPERLIEEVKRRPGIWDFEHVEYRVKNKRHELWSEVVNTLMTGDVKISKSEMRELELQLQKKWKSIRDCFQKYVTHPNRTKRPYLYAKQLGFLKLQKTDAQCQEVGSSDSDSGRRSKRVWKTKKRLKLARQSSDDDNDTADDDYSTVEDATNDSSAKNASGKHNSMVDEFAFANVDQSRTESEDPDKLFLLSLLPHLKTIPDEFRLNVKMEMMQVLRNAQHQVSMDYKII